MGHCYRHLSAEERGTIQALRALGLSCRAVGSVLKRSGSTISRELGRNGYAPLPPPGVVKMGRPRVYDYDATKAGRRARYLTRKARRPTKLVSGGELWMKVCMMVRQYWSPEQVSRQLRFRYPLRPEWQVSHETIYKAIYASARGGLRRELIACLRQHKCARRPRGQGANARGKMKDFQSIHVRPPAADERLLPGHWEGDLIKGSRNQSSIGVLVDRSTLFVQLAKMEGATGLQAMEAFSRVFEPLQEEARRTLTYDQGKEMAQWRELSARTGLKVYFADPHSPWQRGICENINGLLRQYFPKGTDLSVHSQAHLDAIAWRLNTRPRKSLSDHCPAERFYQSLGQHEMAKAADDEVAAVALGV